MGPRLAALGLLAGCAGPGGQEVEVRTSMGAFTIALRPERAPGTVDNFLQYVDEGFYDGTDGEGAGTIYRVVPGFVIQGGGRLASGQAKPTWPAIANEAIASGLRNLEGTVAMARKAGPDTATSEFFVNLVDNPELDPGGSTAEGYAVFGEVVRGWSVVEAIAALPTGEDEAPEPLVVLESVTR